MIKQINELEEQAQWQNIIELIEANVEEKHQDRKEYFNQLPDLLPIYQRACLELGRGANFHHLVMERKLYHYQILLYSSFKGDIQSVKILLANVFNKYSQDEKKYWLAVATGYSNWQESEKIFSDLINCQEDKICHFAKHRLEHKSYPKLPKMNFDLSHLISPKKSVSDKITMPIILLICLNALVFVGQVIVENLGMIFYLIQEPCISLIA